MFEAGHPYKEIGKERCRMHCSKDFGQWAQIMAEESMIDGVVILGAPYISVFADAEELTAEQASEVIGALQVARLKLDEISGAAS